MKIAFLDDIAPIYRERHAGRFARKLAHCCGIRRMHLNSNMSDREQALARQHCARKSQHLRKGEIYGTEETGTFDTCQ